MTALISAELLRIRTLRATRYVVVGMLGLAVMLAVFPPSGPRSALVDSVRSVTLTFVMAAAYIAATQLATEFKRGTAALTYLAHPNRRTVATARVLTYGLIGGCWPRWRRSSRWPPEWWPRTYRQTRPISVH